MIGGCGAKIGDNDIDKICNSNNNNNNNNKTITKAAITTTKTLIKKTSFRIEQQSGKLMTF